MQIKTTTTTTPAPKPDAQPVQAAYIAEDYHSARLHGSYANAAEIAEALASAADLSHEVRGMWLAASAKMRAKAQPMQIIITFRPLAAFISAPPPQVVTGDEEFLTAVTAAVKDNPSVGSVSVPE